MRTSTRIIAALATASLFALTGCGSDTTEALGDDLGTKDNPVQLGVVGKSDPYWAVYEKAVEDAGISVDIVDFTEYSLPNPALSEGELDINQFQHVQYLADYNVNSDDDLQPIGATAIYPLGLYSKKYDTPEDIPDGETVIVPNDTVNQARGLLVLQSAGLISLKEGGDASSTLEDIDEDKSRVEVEAVNADLTVNSMPDVAAAIVNNDFLGPAGLENDDAIAADDPNDPKSLPYVNIFAARAADKDNKTLLKLVDIFQDTQAVLDGLQKQSGGAAIFTQPSAKELQDSLAQTESALQP